MKRHFLLAILVISCLLFAGCQKAEFSSVDSRELHYQAYLLSEMNSKIRTDQLTEFQITYGMERSYKSEDAAQELSVAFRGTTYQGVYECSYRGKGTIAERDRYVASGPICTGFEVDHTTGALLWINLAGYGQVVQLSELNKPILAEKTIEKLATDYASDWISVKDYDLVEKTVRAGRGEMADLYVYSFTKTVHGVKTTDSIYVYISDRGVLHMISVLEIGWTEKYRKELSAFSVEEAVNTAKTVSGLTNPTVNTQKFGITPDGKIVLMVSLLGGENEAPVELAILAD